MNVSDLTPDEKLELVFAIWDDLAANPTDVAVNDWQLAEVERRQARLAANPETGLSWEELLRRVRSRPGNRLLP
jgi:putative addiction module component (TIGR02574 family)